MRHALTAGVLMALLCLASAATSQAPAAPAAAAPAAPAAAAEPAAPELDPSTYITVQVKNDCKDKTILAAAMLNTLDGEWEPQGFWRLAPGETAEAGKTTNRAYYVYAHELGDPDCAKGCWSGVVEKDLQGEPWPFLEKTMKPQVTLGDTVVHKFKC
ncbi:MAG: hypothetical protein J3K34DRAFT_472622 [Monoraphidium minutum]|nr:MAG: hypothetical protein J3K34DRAFT_472622 [Monoraphidium minutum]